MADCTLTERDAWRLLVQQVRLAAAVHRRARESRHARAFARFPTVEAMAAADIGEVEELIRSCGLPRQARDLVRQAQRITEVYGGKVPDNMDDLLTPRRGTQERQSHSRRRVPSARRGRGGHALHPSLEPSGSRR